MSEEEMVQHLALCLKLDAENKINTKNAFGLHLIDIMHHKIKHSIPDLQSASMSLQASSKIYAGRVDALYKETMQFHNQLQTIVLNKKVVEGRDQDIDGDDDNVDDEPKERRRTTKTKQSYITNEDNVSFKSEATYQNTMPHANYIAIKSAFCASRTAPKLLERLPLENDSCKLACVTALPCFNPLAPVPVVDFSYPAKRKGLIQKIQNVRLNYVESQSGTFCSDVFPPPSFRSPVGAPDMDPPSDDSFVIGSSPVREPQDADVEEIIDKFSVLDITADILVKDLSHAVVDANTVDRNRFPPNSALKRVLNTAEKSKVGKTPVKIRKEKAPREPFFNQQRVVDKAILKKTRRNELTDKDIDQWTMNDITAGSNGIELFSTLFSDNINIDNKRTILCTLQNLMLENTPQYFDGCFCKELQLWNKYGKQRNAQLIRPSSFGVCMNNNESEEIISEHSNFVVQSFQNLSLENSPANSPARSDDYDPGIDNMAPPDAGNMADSFAFENPISNHPSRRSGLFDDDLKSVMVTPPEMAQPITMRFETKPITLSTEKVKNAIWNVVEQAEETLLTELHQKLQKVFYDEFMPLQYVFTTLLILANEKCLLLENDSLGEIKVMKDILE
uniref:Condensin complex subunit 2 n=1 Tax=Parasteatoda tepidariorum TaxID=114398 RepID=A0A2L2YKQ2_PARTP